MPNNPANARELPFSCISYRQLKRKGLKTFSFLFGISYHNIFVLSLRNVGCFCLRIYVDIRRCSFCEINGCGPRRTAAKVVCGGITEAEFWNVKRNPSLWYGIGFSLGLVIY